MEYIYAAMLLHKAGQKIDEASVKKVLEASNINIFEARIKALVSVLEGVDIEKAIATASILVVQPMAKQKTEEKEIITAPVEDKSEERAAIGLDKLFG